MRTVLVAAVLFLVIIIAGTTGTAQNAGSAGSGPVGDPVNGKAVFAFGNTSCTNCHGLEGQGGWGPDLAGRRITYDAAVRAIRNPMWRMPAFVPSQLSDQEIADMVAYWNTLPVSPTIGKWRNEAPFTGPRGQQVAVNILGCGQCHGNTLSTPRHGAAQVNGDFEWFKRQVYNHAAAMPAQWKEIDAEAPRQRGRVRMGNFSPKRVPEPQLKEIWDWMNDLGMLVPVVARLTGGPAEAAGTTYTLDIENEALPQRQGWTAEDVTVSVVVPAGTRVVSATGTGYQGVARDAQANADVATWRVPSLRPKAHEKLTFVLSGTPAGDAVPRGTIGWAKPTAKADALVNFVLQRPGGRGRGAA